MRLHFHTAVPALVTLVGSVSALFAPASASEADPASEVRGSLGVSLDDLAFGTGAGTTVFLLAHTVSRRLEIRALNAAWPLRIC
jgi:hypothetical protein